MTIEEVKKNKFNLILDYFMVPISIFMAIDYLLRYLEGDDSTIHIIALCVWILASFVWPMKLVYDLKRKKTLTE